MIYSSYSSLCWLKAKKTWMEMITVESWWWPWRSSSPHHDGETQGRVSLHEWSFQSSVLHEPSWWCRFTSNIAKDRISERFHALSLLCLGRNLRYECHTASSSSSSSKPTLSSRTGPFNLIWELIIRRKQSSPHTMVKQSGLISYLSSIILLKINDHPVNNA